jgi:hypothetical protein
MQSIETEEVNNMTIVEFVKYIQKKYYPDLDISFMDFYMSLHQDNDSENKFIISSDNLAHYGILSIKKDRNIVQSKDVKDLIERLYLIENEDYILRLMQTSQLEKDGITRSKYRDEYMFTPDAFKKCLICSVKRENIKYKNYYIFLEKCIYYYNKQQLIEKNKEIKSLHNKIDSLISEIKEQTTEIRELRKTIDKIIDKLKDRAVPPTEKELEERFIIMKNVTINEYYVIRCQKKSVQKSIKIKSNEGYIVLQDIIESVKIPNSVYLWHLIKEQLKENRQISIFRNTFTLNNLNEKEFIEIVKEVFNNRIDYN